MLFRGNPSGYSRDIHTVEMATSPKSEIEPPAVSSEMSRISVAEVVNRFQSDVVTGLSQGDISQRRNVHGRNELEVAEKETLLQKFIDQLKQPLILLLFGSALVSVVLGSYDDAISITLAILIVSTVAFIQEYRSEQSLEALNRLVPYTCTVVRGGLQQTVSASELVPGDIIRLTTGDRVPADVRLIEVISVEVDESTLTGEPKPSKKVTSIINTPDGVEVPLAERKNIAFMGTLVRQGHASGVVIATGEHTEFGRVFRMMKDLEEKKTPLQLKMDQLGKQLSILSFGVIGVIFVLGLLQGRHWLEMFTIAVSLAVAAIPEGLPIVVTVTLALGVMRMANRKAIVKKLPSVEALGSVNVICVDKTGTLTRNQMTATKLFTAGQPRIVDVNELKNSRQNGAPLSGDVELLLRVATLCNNSALTSAAPFFGSSSNSVGIRTTDYLGPPTEVALMVMARQLGAVDSREKFERLQEIPFNSEHKWMAVQCAERDQPFPNPLFFVKGAPEVLLSRCTSFYMASAAVAPLSDETRSSIQVAIRQMSELGLRVLALSVGREASALLTFVGLVGMVDPPRDGIADSIKQLITGGVQIVMMTGDAKETAATVGQQLGIVDPTMPLEVQLQAGPSFEAMDERSQIRSVRDISVFYRATPQHKLSIVKAWQANGAIVGMTGDGVNDAPALKMADIGIAMGINGTDVSKEAADMILVDDNFTTILSAIEEGKSIYYNIKNFVRFQLSTSISALSLIAISTVMGLPNPLNAMQILWINIIMDGPPAQSLGVEPVDVDVMKRPPRDQNETIIDRTLITRVLTSAACIVTGTMFVYIFEMNDGKVTDRDTTMTFTTFVLFDLFNALSCRSESKSVFQLGFASNKMFLYACGGSLFVQLGVIYVPFLQAILQTEALFLSDLVFMICVASSVLWVDEVRKFISRQRSPSTVSYV